MQAALEETVVTAALAIVLVHRLVGLAVAAVGVLLAAQVEHTQVA